MEKLTLVLCIAFMTTKNESTVFRSQNCITCKMAKSAAWYRTAVNQTPDQGT
jgi:hypothetical protein